MSDNASIDLSRLRDPFPYEDLEWRIQNGGAKDSRPWAKVLTYITARAIHDRLDEVCGPENWQLRYLQHHQGTICEIGIRIDGEWVWKAGGADDTNIEAFKGGLSSAEKRAGVPWGIGRYLYKLKASWAQFTSNKEDALYHSQLEKDNNGKTSGPLYHWNPPQLPPWALPEGASPQEPTQSQRSSQPSQSSPPSSSSASPTQSRNRKKDETDIAIAAIWQAQKWNADEAREDLKNTMGSAAETLGVLSPTQKKQYLEDLEERFSHASA